MTNKRLVLATTKKEGFFKSVPCYLVFTDDEIIFTFLSKERQKKENEEFKKKLKEEGKGFFKGTAALLNFWNTYGERYYDIPTEEILKEESRNNKILHNDITKFIFRSMKRNDESQTTLGKITIYLNDEKMKFDHKYEDFNKQIKDILNGLYPNKLKYFGQSGLTISLGKNKNNIR